MYELDHMLNGRGSQKHHQEIIRQVQNEHLARLAEANGKSILRSAPERVRQIRTVLAGVVHTLTG